MKAAVSEHLNRPITVREFEQPQPHDGELLVRVIMAGVNPIDWKMLARGDRTLPFVLGQDFAGVVSAVGTGVTKYRQGERILGIAREHGSYAQYTVVPEEQQSQPVAKLPDDVGDADAAALPTPGLTALAAIERLGIGQGTTLVVLGATGSVGGFAVQIARDRGAYVIGTGRSSGASIVTDLGAQEFAAYDTGNAREAIKAKHPGGVDAVLDLVDDGDAVKATLDILRPGGKIVSTIGALDQSQLRERGLDGDNLVLANTPQSSHSGLRTLLEMLQQGRLRTTIAAEEPLAEAARAIDRSKNGSLNGKVLITIE